MKIRPFNPLKSIIFTLCLAFALSACSKTPPDYSGSSSVRMYRNSDTDIITLKIPNGYLDHFVLAGPPVPGAKEDTAEVKHRMYFTAEAGTLKPRSTENNQAFVHPNSLTDEFSFNISTVYARPPGEVPLALQSTYASRIWMFANSCAIPPKAKPRFGLEWYARDIPNCPKQIHAGRKEDMLIERDTNGQVKTFLICTSDEIPDRADQVKSGHLLGNNPKCEHEYYLKELNARVSLFYSRFYVKDWRLLEQRINALLLSFVQTPSNP